MLWLFNPSCPDASPTHPMWDLPPGPEGPYIEFFIKEEGGIGWNPAPDPDPEIGIGIGISQSAPPFFHIRTLDEPENDLPPEQPFAVGVFLLQAMKTQTISILKAEPTRPTNNRPLAEWRDLPEKSWVLKLRAIDVTRDEAQPLLGLYGGWYLHYQGPETDDLYLPLMYTCGPNKGGFDPMIGGTFERILPEGTVGNQGWGQPRFIEVSPFWPGPDFVPGRRARS
jgi:hypothetical protein